MRRNVPPSRSLGVLALKAMRTGLGSHKIKEVAGHVMQN